MDKVEIAKVLWKTQMWQIYQNWDGFLLFLKMWALLCSESHDGRWEFPTPVVAVITFLLFFVIQGCGVNSKY